MTTPGSDSRGRSAQEKIDAILRPRWCVEAEKGRLYWDLVCAAIRNDAPTIRGHLKTDPDCARLEFWYTPPLTFAVREGSLDATRVLWEAYPFDEVPNLIQMADDRGHDRVAAYLRASLGAAAEASDLRLHQAVEARDCGEAARLLADVPGIAGNRDRQGRTALHLAVLGGDGDAVGTLLAGGAEVDAVDHRGFRAAHYAFWKSPYWGSGEGGDALLQMLLDAGSADSPALAAARGDLGVLRAFVEADPAAANEGEGLQKTIYGRKLMLSHVKAHISYTCMHLHAPTITHTHAHTHTHACTHARTHTHTHTPTCKHMLTPSTLCKTSPPHLHPSH